MSFLHCEFGFLAMLLLIAPAIEAHHSHSIYDLENEIRLEGVVTSFQWTYPHVYIEVETADGDDRRAWTVEASPPAGLSGRGWSASSLVSGDRVMITANPARNLERRHVLGISVIKDDGSLLSLSGNEPTAPSRFVATDLFGHWVTRTDSEMVERFFDPLSAWSLTEGGVAAIESYDDSSMNPSIECVPEPVPSEMLFPSVHRIELNEDTITILAEANERTIHMNLESHDGAPYSYQGHSIGRWEESVLVVDTRNFLEHRRGNAWGLPSSPQRHLIERFGLNEDGVSFSYTFRVEDPAYLAEPITGALELVYRPDLPFVREPCDPQVARRFFE